MKPAKYLAFLTWDTIILANSLAYFQLSEDELWADHYHAKILKLAQYN